MTGPVSDRLAMISGMAPDLRPGLWCFVTDPAPAPRAMAAALASFAETEGVSLILPADRAADLGYAPGPAMAQITLTVHSSLEGVGLTAAVATALAEAGIPCNMVAAFHHDHVFVPEDRAGEAMAILRALQARATAER